MKEIITNELIQYKTGFIDGKNEIVDAFKLGKVIRFEEEKEREEKESWYKYGYEDGFNYFSNLINNNKLDLNNTNTKEIIKNHFAERVLKINQEQGREIPTIKFRI